MSINIPQALERLCYRYPSMLVDAILEHEPGRRLVAVKNVTINEEFFPGHFPGAPLLPAVLMVESLSQAAAILVRDQEATPRTRVYLRGVNGAKFRRQVVPGDRLRLEITLSRRRGAVVFAQATAYAGDQLATECQLVLGVVSDGTFVHPAANVHPNATIGAVALCYDQTDKTVKAYATTTVVPAVPLTWSRVGPAQDVGFDLPLSKPYQVGAIAHAFAGQENVDVLVTGLSVNYRAPVEGTCAAALPTQF